MRDWPTDDPEIVAAIVAGDRAGLAAAYDRYATALHTYCRTLLAEPADAADAVQDTFVVAASKLAGLREPDRLRPWLYAVARNECHRRLRARGRTADLDEAGEVTDASADVGGAAERGELRDLVRSAIAGLNPGEQEVIELSLRHELDGADLAGALGVPLNQAHALASRARGQLERSLGALLVARTGRESCPELDALLAGWDGRLTILLRKRVSRHIERCEVCDDRKRRELSPAMLLSALPVFMLPPGLRHQVLQLVSDATPDAVSYRESVARRAEPFGGSGFPVPIFAIARVRPRGRTVAYAAAAARRLAARLQRHGTVGLSSFYLDPVELPRAVQEAELVLDVLRQSDAPIAEDIGTGTYRLLFRVLASHPEEVRSFYQDTVAPIVSYDDQYGTDLAGTLEAYLEQNCNMNATAAAIYAHRHTVAYRLERVRELTGLDPMLSEDRERLGLGLKAYRIIAPRLPK